MGCCCPAVWFMMTVFIHTHTKKMFPSLTSLFPPPSLTLPSPRFSLWKTDCSGLIHKGKEVIFTACRHVKVRHVKCSWWLCQMAALAVAARRGANVISTIRGLYTPPQKQPRWEFRAAFGGDKEGSVLTSQSDNKTSTATGSNGIALLDRSVMRGIKKNREGDALRTRGPGCKGTSEAPPESCPVNNSRWKVFSCLIFSLAALFPLQII